MGILKMKIRQIKSEMNTGKTNASNTLARLLSELNENINSFSKKIGLDRAQALYDIEKGNTKSISSNIRDKIVKTYPNINLTFLLTGEGDVILNNKSNAKQVYRKTIPVTVVPRLARAGYAQQYNDQYYLETLPKIPVALEDTDDNYVIFEIDGDSMDDGTKNAILSGDQYLCKELDRSFWIYKLHFNQYLFVIVYDNDVICKKITAHDTDTGDIVCHSYNSFYDDRIINLSDVSQLFYVVKLIDRAIKL